MALFQSLLYITNFHNPLLQTLVPSIQAVFIIQTAFAIPSIISQTEKFYDFSGALTYLSVTALSLYLPALRDRYATGLASKAALPSLLSPFKALGGTAAFNWRQVALSGAVAIWAIRCTQRIDSPCKRDRANLFCFAELKWVRICSIAS